MGVYLDELHGFTRYFGTDEVYGENGGKLPPDTHVFVFFAESPTGKGGLHDMPIHEMIEQRFPDQASIQVYPVAYKAA